MKDRQVSNKSHLTKSDTEIIRTNKSTGEFIQIREETSNSSSDLNSPPISRMLANNMAQFFKQNQVNLTNGAANPSLASTNDATTFSLPSSAVIIAPPQKTHVLANSDRPSHHTLTNIHIPEEPLHRTLSDSALLVDDEGNSPRKGKL
jgi:hypothetical protein